MEIETLGEDLAPTRAADEAPEPGLVVVHSGDRPRCLVFPLQRGALVLGRDALEAAGIPDGRVSRQHARVEFDAGSWTVRDLESRNGTLVDGAPADGARRSQPPIIRIGRTLLLPVTHRRPYEELGVIATARAVLGPALQAAHRQAAAVARGSTGLLIAGPSGTGKELAAAAFHAATREGTRPFVAVNCATIPKDLAERVLFGTRRGAYTGAVTDASGLVQAADGGTLFLDEVAELDPGVQAKLLRVLETRQLTPLGGAQPVTVDVRVCAATHRNLRAEVAAGRFREDLYFRVGRPVLRLPPLSERREEIPWLIGRALASQGVVAGVDFVEACLLRAWPGNVRELLAEATTAALAATTRRRAVVAASDLDAEAGLALDDAAAGASPEERPEAPVAATPEAIEEALRAEQGNVARAAARVGLTRSRVRRFIERHAIDLKKLRPA